MEKFIANLANNYVNAKDEGIEAALAASNDTGVGQATPVVGTPGAEPSLNEGTQAAYDRITGKLPKLQTPDTKTMEDHYKFRLAEAEKQGDKTFIGELKKNMLPLLVGGGVGIVAGPKWGALAGAGTAAAVASAKISEDPLDDLPDQYDGLGRNIP